MSESKRPSPTEATPPASKMAKVGVSLTLDDILRNPAAHILAQVMKVNIGGGIGEKKPTWALFLIGNSTIIRYTMWNNVVFEKLGIKVGDIVEFSGVHLQDAYKNFNRFIPNYMCRYELVGPMTVHERSAPTLVTAPLLTSTTVHQAVGAGRVTGVSKVISEPTMSSAPSLRPGEEDVMVPNQTFQIQLDDDASETIVLWGKFAEETKVVNGQTVFFKNAYVSDHTEALSVSERTATPVNPHPVQPSIVVVTEAELHQLSKHRPAHIAGDKTTLKAARLKLLNIKWKRVSLELEAIMQEYQHIAAEP